MKSIKYLKLIILLVIGLFSHYANAATFVDGIYYTFNTSSKTAYVAPAAYNFGGYAGDVVIPSTVEYEGVTYTVTKISDQAFYKCSSLSSLTIPSTVTAVSGTNVFYGCTGLKSIIIEDSEDPITIPGCQYQENLGNTKATFHFAALEKVYVGRSILLKSVYYSDSPFCGQTQLSDITIGKMVKILPPGFVYGSSINDLFIPDGVESIGERAFGSCKDLKELKLPSSVTLLGGSVASSSGIETLYLGDGIKEIPTAAFHSCENLKDVYIGCSLTQISLNAFCECEKLTNIYLFSDNLTNIGNSAIPQNVATIYVPNPSRYTKLFEDFYLDNLLTISNPTVTYSGKTPEFAFYNNTPIKDVTFSVDENCINVGTYSCPIQVMFKKDQWESRCNIPVSYTITPASLTVIGNDASRKYGEENPELSCSIFGFKNGETKDVLTKQPVVETTATAASNAGTYPIIPSGAEAQNYTFTYERGTLTVLKADQTIEWEQEFGSVSVGDEMELTATSSAGLPIKYTTTDETIADIFTRNGKKYVEFLKPGTVAIRANQEGNENYNEADRVSKSVKVGMFVTGITLNQTTLTLNEGSSAQLSATVTPAEATNKTLTWESSNPSVATVDANGNVKAMEQGTAIITVKSTDGTNITAQCEVTVVKLVSGISLNVASATLNEGQSLQLQATVMPESANNKSLVWSSSNEAVAVVSQDGKVTAISKGSAVILVKSADGSDMSATCNIEVNRLVSDLTLNKTSIVLTEGQSDQLIAAIAPESANNKVLEWISSDDAVAIVSQDGKVTAISKGIAVITAKTTDGSDITATCSVTVVRLVSDIELDMTSVELHPGESVTLHAEAIPADASNTNLVWSSSDNSVVAVSDGIVSAIKVGTAIITVSTCDGSGITKQCEVKVSEIDGITDIYGDSEYIGDVFNLQGHLIVRNATTDDIRKLASGIYIIRNNDKTVKIKL